MMAYFLGVDTGGTYTDAVIVDEAATRVIGSAKSLTTRHDLAEGIGKAVDAALAQAGVAARDVALVSLSTTLATNALVEGQGGRVALVFIGFDDADLERGGLVEALKGDPVIRLAGGHNHAGIEAAKLDLARLEAEVAALADQVMGFAVAASFATRNPAHEVVAREVIRRVTGRPVTCSHELSAHLNGPKRALTAVLNARLIGMIDRLVSACEGHLAAVGIDAPLMVVRGDGALVAAAVVRERPIETILSGPAASLVGAAHLTGLDDAIISDIGGTTTDIAVLRGGVPNVSPDGATVGGHRTMVQAVAMHTHGLGGDSRVVHDVRAAGCVLLLGPRKVVPMCQLAVTEAELVHPMLDQQLTNQYPGELDGMVLIAERWSEWLDRLEGNERAVLQAMGGRVAVAAKVLATLQMRRVMERLVQRGVLQVAAFTPTDASHVLGIQSTYDAVAAEKTAELFARNRDRMGRAIAADAHEVSQRTIDTLVRRSAEAVRCSTGSCRWCGCRSVWRRRWWASARRQVRTIRASRRCSVPSRASPCMPTWPTPSAQWWAECGSPASASSVRRSTASSSCTRARRRWCSSTCCRPAPTRSRTSPRHCTPTWLPPVHRCSRRVSSGWSRPSRSTAWSCSWRAASRSPRAAAPNWRAEAQYFFLP